MKCKKCGKEMIIISKQTGIMELPDNATDGQITDYNTMEDTGEYDKWMITETIYECTKCHVLYKEITK